MPQLDAKPRFCGIADSNRRRGRAIASISMCSQSRSRQGVHACDAYCSSVEVRIVSLVRRCLPDRWCPRRRLVREGRSAACRTTYMIHPHRSILCDRSMPMFKQSRAVSGFAMAAYVLTSRRDLDTIGQAQSPVRATSVNLYAIERDPTARTELCMPRLRLAQQQCTPADPT